MPFVHSTLSKYKSALKKYAYIANNADKKEKHRYIYPLRSSGLSLKHCKDLGFHISKWLWVKCLNKSKRNKGPLFFNFWNDKIYV